MKKWSVVAAVLVVSGLLAQGCALLLVGAVVGTTAAGTVSYLGNELRVTQEVGMDKAWNAANAAVTELQFAIVTDHSSKDAIGGTLMARNAKDQPVRIVLIRSSDRLTEIRIRVGTFDTTANREGAQLIFEKMRPKM